MPGPTTGQVITRFAPSPTGALHVGGARTALFNWAFARHHDGKFVLRFEDTDQKRSSDQSAQSILEDLQWLGIDFDQGPFRQSERLNHYNQHIDRLLADGYAYEDGGAIRFRMNSDVAFDDAVYGHIEVKARELEDFVIRKADGFPTFHLAVVVDDALMNVTHVIRGQEHLTNTTKHVALQDAFAYARPVFTHTPTILNPDGSKMSKRDKAKAAREAARSWLKAHGDLEDLAKQCAQKCDKSMDAIADFIEKRTDDIEVGQAIAKVLEVSLPEIEIEDFRSNGYLPDVLCNYLALLGWSPGNDVERFDLTFLKEHFGFDRINKSNAHFDREKLRAFNGGTIRQLPPGDWRAMLRSYMLESRPGQIEKLDDHFTLFADCYHERSQTLDDPTRLGKAFFMGDDQVEYDAKAVKKQLTRSNGEGLNSLRQLALQLDACNDWSPKAVDETITTFADKNGLGLGRVAQPLRVAVMGNAVSPPIGDTLVILGKVATLERIDRCLRLHSGNISPRHTGG